MLNCIGKFTSHTSWYMGYIAEHVRRFYHPAAIDEMLSTFLPLMNGTSLSVSDNILSSVGPQRLNIGITIEHASNTILPPDILANVTSAILPPDTIPGMGIDKLVHVRRTHALIPV